MVLASLLRISDQGPALDTGLRMTAAMFVPLAVSALLGHPWSDPGIRLAAVALLVSQAAQSKDGPTPTMAGAVPSGPSDPKSI